MRSLIFLLLFSSQALGALFVGNSGGGLIGFDSNQQSIVFSRSFNESQISDNSHFTYINGVIYYFDRKNGNSLRQYHLESANFSNGPSVLFETITHNIESNQDSLFGSSPDAGQFIRYDISNSTSNALGYYPFRQWGGLVYGDGFLYGLDNNNNLKRLNPNDGSSVILENENTFTVGPNLSLAYGDGKIFGVGGNSSTQIWSFDLLTQDFLPTGASMNQYSHLEYYNGKLYYNNLNAPANVGYRFSAYDLQNGTEEILSNQQIFPNYQNFTVIPNPVPLPAGIYLFLSGLVGLGLMRGRKSK